ncbi:hypothetical protein [Streptomyces sp. MZ04]|uniref:hypothetical protein n=1 Tax=Streptomyces sp. MZ04 TaxID=2559236 RepID=UPI001432DF4D|nr:hypothetical protein [Streptomyces sp. MZ04]
MSHFQQVTDPDRVTVRTPRRGAGSLVLGAVAVSMIGCPWLPGGVSPWLRFFPVYLIVPAGICAVVAGFGALRSLRGEEAADRRWARVGVGLGAVAIVVPVSVVIWAWVVLSRMEA